MLNLVVYDNAEKILVQGNYDIWVDGKKVGSLDISKLWEKWYVTLELIDYSLTIEQHLSIMGFLKELGFPDDQPVFVKTV